MRSQLPPQHVAVVGGGIVGLSVAWSLLGAGVDVTVVERAEVGRGASWGNAGYVVPAFTAPLAEPGLVRVASHALLSRSSPLGLRRPDLNVVNFLPALVRRSNQKSWTEAMLRYAPFRPDMLDAFDEQVAQGVAGTLHKSELLIALTGAGEGVGVLKELESAASQGQGVGMRLVTAEEARVLEPCLSRRITHAIVVDDQRYIEPAAYCAALAMGVKARGGRLLEHFPVTRVDGAAPKFGLGAPGFDRLDVDAVVIATGSALPELARAHGVRTRVVAGRGYSFSSPADPLATRPILLPSAKIAMTPRAGRLSISGVMEIGRSDSPISPSRMAAMVRSVSPLLDGVDLGDRRDVWVGSRPLTPDGLPLVGSTGTPGVYVAGGHGMWGVTGGPLTGRLLAELITGERDRATMAALDPLR